jgi:hypothetical protein
MPYESEFTGQYFRPYEEEDMLAPGVVGYINGIHRAIIKFVSTDGTRLNVEEETGAFWYGLDAKNFHLEQREGLTNDTD